jgi:hypothetical protein
MIFTGARDLTVLIELGSVEIRPRFLAALGMTRNRNIAKQKLG